LFRLSGVCVHDTYSEVAELSKHLGEIKVVGVALLSRPLQQTATIQRLSNFSAVFGGKASSGRYRVVAEARMPNRPLHAD